MLTLTKLKLTAAAIAAVFVLGTGVLIVHRAFAQAGPPTPVPAGRPAEPASQPSKDMALTDAPATSGAERFEGVRVVLSAFDMGLPTAYADLDTGKTLQQAPVGTGLSVDQMRRAGVDLYVGVGQSNTFDRQVLDMGVMEVPAADWDAKPERIVRALAWVQNAKSGTPLGAGRTYFFRTTMGPIGFGVVRLSPAADMQTKIEIKRIRSEVSAAILAQQPKPDLSTPEALIRTYLFAVDTNDTSNVMKCLAPVEGVPPSWLEHASELIPAAYRLWSAAVARFGEAKVKETLGNLFEFEIPDAKKLAEVKWVQEGDRAKPAPGSDPSVTSVELWRSGKDWHVVTGAGPHVVDAAPAMARAAKATADRLLLDEKTTMESAEDVRVEYLRNLADAEAVQSRTRRSERSR